MPSTKVAVPRELLKGRKHVEPPKVAGESPAERGWEPPYLGPRR